MKSNMLEYLEHSAARVPEKVAFYDEQISFTFAQLYGTARRIGSCLLETVLEEGPVALLLNARSARNAPAVFGVMYAGRAYAPLDIAQPPERLSLILSRLRPAAVLADAKGLQAIKGWQGAIVLCFDQAVQAPENPEALQSVRQKANENDPMSILFTSGSTGIPKGSVQTHSSYLRWTEATIEKYGLTEDVVFANQAPFFYANSILELFPPVALGATVYLLPAGLLTFPKKLIQALNERKITLLCMTPSSFISVVHTGALTPKCLPGLKWGIMCGEAMPWLPLKTWMDAAPAASWWHFYGSTEMFAVAVGKIDRAYQPDDRLPVGKPFSQVRILFLDAEGKAVPAGQPGEMVVSSPWIATGYYGESERTAAAFVSDPLNEGGQERFYISGDTGYLTDDGQLMVLGRKDRQIKHRGYRMELGDVDAALAAVPGLQEGCALFDGDSDRVFCFYTGSLTEKELQGELRKRLPRYMLPDETIRLEAMPRTATMKRDNARLRLLMKKRTDNPGKENI